MDKTVVAFFVLFHISVCIVGVRAVWNVSFPMTENQFNNLSCQSRWSCANITSRYLDRRVLNIRERNCACQESCLFFGDCCSDFEGVNRTSLAYYTQTPTENIHCIAKKRVSTFNHYSVVSCPEGVRNTTVGQYCETESDEDSFTDIPVTGRTSHHTFKNMYCAICHGEAYIVWTIAYDCDHRSGINAGAPLQNVFGNRFCTVKYLPPKPEFLHLCWKNKESTAKCSPEFAGPETVQLCNEAEDFSKAVFTSSGDLVKNKHCAACRNAMPKCEPERRQVFRGYSLQILVNINENNLDSNDDTYDCPETQIFNPLSVSCVHVYCPETWAFKGGVCTPKNIETSTVLLQNSSWTETNSSQPFGDEGSNTDTTLNCPFMQVSMSEFDVVNGTLRHDKSSETFSKSEFIVNNGSVYVCVEAFLAKVDGFKPKLANINFKGIEGIVTFTGMLISIIALCITLIVYAIFPQLRNIPGKIIISLSACLLVADILMMVSSLGESVYTACVSLAILMHFFFLSAFFWMNVSALNLYFTFAKSFVNADSETNRNKFIKFCLYAWISPVILVAISVILNFSDVDWKYQPAYGRVICWMNNPIPLIIFFLCPLLVILCVNILCFTLAVKKICSAKRSTARVLGTVNKLDILIYFKLSLVIGLTWIFGVLAAFVSHPAVVYIFIVLNTLQGVFICLAFVCTRRVINLMKERANSTRRSSTASGKSVKTVTYRLSS